MTDTKPHLHLLQNIDLPSVNDNFYFAQFRRNQSICFIPLGRVGVHSQPHRFGPSPLLSNRIFTMTLTVTVHAIQYTRISPILLSGWLCHVPFAMIRTPPLQSIMKAALAYAQEACRIFCWLKFILLSSSFRFCGFRCSFWHVSDEML